MRKTITDVSKGASGSPDQTWLDLEKIASVEVTSEDPQFPIDSALGKQGGAGWRASRPGAQQIRILFDAPVSLHRIELSFREEHADRTQEFTLRWRPAGGGPAKDIVRQRWNFSPAGSTVETERYTVDLHDVAALELAIEPDVARQGAVASLASWRVG